MQDLRTANKQRRRQQILQGAHDLIARDGLPALTMRTLADEAAVSIPTIYALIGGRDDVIAALMEFGARRFDTGVDALASHGLARVTGIVALFADIVDHERDLVHALLASGALVSGRPEPLLLFHRGQVALDTAFHQAVADGTLAAGTDAAFASRSLVRLCMGAVIDWVVEQGAPDELRADLMRSVSVVIGAFA